MIYDKMQYEAVLRTEIEQLRAALTLSQAKVEEMREALEEIAKGEGGYSLDPLKHAENTITNAIEIAQKALSTSGSQVPNDSEKKV